MATHSSVLAWRIPGSGEPGGLPSMGLHRVRNDWSDLAAAGCSPRIGIAGSYGGFVSNFFFFFKESPYCLPQWWYQFIFPPTIEEGSLSSTLSPAFIVCRIFHDGHSGQCEVISHCSFDFHFSNNGWCWAPFQVFVSHLYVFFGVMPV